MGVSVSPRVHPSGFPPRCRLYRILAAVGRVRLVPGALAAAAHGVTTIYVETSNYHSPADVMYPASLRTLVRLAHAQGIKVVPWYLPGYRSLALDQRRFKAAVAELAPVIEARHSSRHAESEQKAKQREHGSFNRSNSLVSGIGVPARPPAESRLPTGNYAEEHAHGQGDRPF